MKRNILITGGAGFIGSHVVRLFVNKYPDYRIVNLDKLTYAGNLANLKDIEEKPNYTFVRADIADLEEMRRVIRGIRDRRDNTPRRREPCGPVDKGPVHFRAHQRDGNSRAAAGR